MLRNLRISLLYTLATTVLFGVLYPLVVTSAAQLLFKDKANGQLIQKKGQLVGSRLIGQPFSAPGYFHSRPSEAGNGYDAANSSGSNLGPTSAKLVSRMEADVAVAERDHPGQDVPVDLVTASASGLDPDITPAAAEYQVARIARERHLSEPSIRALVAKSTQERQLGFLGEPRVNVLLLNLALDQAAPLGPQR